MVQEHREALATVNRRLDVLQQLDAAHVRGREGLLSRLAEVGVLEPRFLGDLARAPKGWGRCIDFFLDHLSEAVLVPEGTDPLEIADALRETRTPAILIGELGEDQAFTPIEDPAIVASLSEALELPPGLARALPPAYLVETAEQAERLARLHPTAAFASRQSLWARGGLLHLEGERKTPGTLERRQEMGVLEKDLPGLRRDVETAEAELADAVAKRTQRAEEIHRQDAMMAVTQRELAVAQARREDLAGRVRRLEKEGANLEKERHGLVDEASRLVEDGSLAAQRVVDLEEAHAGLQQQFDLAQSVVEESRRQREQLRAEGAARQGRLDLLTERLRGLDLERSRLQREIVAADQQRERWSQELRGLEERQERLEASLHTAEQELTEALTRRDGSQDSILKAQEILDGHREMLREVEGQVEVKRKEREETRDRVEGLRIELAEIQGEEQHLRDAYREQLGRELPQQAAASDEDLAQLERRLVETKGALERLGPVNELASSEYEEHEERHTYLLEQRIDVADSVASLKRTIQEINQTSSERFLATFAEVNQKFGEVFESLFNGGEAEMRLLDEDDILESGIEIVARPPGKRLQNLLLLSGGEKALTAIALLMALFHTKASPFCIFDEVDAPLDDPNTVRFVDIIKKMSRDTQFIVITHNKLTMQAASTLYGVTMQERGVSKTVAVELDEVQPESRLASVS
jgi:chromosome segregation protein